jgi:DNA-binding NarL/FixJ family response regulator
MSSIRILIVNEQKSVRQSLSTVLGLLDGIEVTAEAADGREAARLASRLAVDVVLMDSTLSAADELEAARRIKEISPGVGIVMFSRLGNENAKPPAGVNPVDAFVEKRATAEKLAAVIRQVHRRKEKST